MFRFSQRSLNNLKGIHEHLVAVAKRALELTTVDFVVIDGLRTQEEQEQLFAAGSAQTLNSRHLTGHAIDVVAWVDGRINWDATHFYPIAAAFQQAARELDVGITWGAVWDRKLNNINGLLQNAVSLYRQRRTARRRRAFLDFGHFELNRREYP